MIRARGGYEAAAGGARGARGSSLGRPKEARMDRDGTKNLKMFLMDGGRWTVDGGRPASRRIVLSLSFS